MKENPIRQLFMIAGEKRMNLNCYSDIYELLNAIYENGFIHKEKYDELKVELELWN